MLYSLTHSIDKREIAITARWLSAKEAHRIEVKKRI